MPAEPWFGCIGQPPHLETTDTPTAPLLNGMFYVNNKDAFPLTLCWTLHPRSLNQIWCNLLVSYWAMRHSFVNMKQNCTALNLSQAHLQSIGFLPDEDRIINNTVTYPPKTNGWQKKLNCINEHQQKLLQHSLHKHDTSNNVKPLKKNTNTLKSK